MLQPPNRSKRTSGRGVLLVVTVLLVTVVLLVYISLINQIHIQHSSTAAALENGISSSSSNEKRLEDRIRYLETKIDSYLAYGKDPFLSMKMPATCKVEMSIKKIACPGNNKCELDNSNICLDDMPFALGGGDKTTKKKNDNCVVYDFGIRESPDFGMAFAPHCDVVGFDPSPISVKWWKTNQKKIQAKHPTYDYSPVGAGGIDGDIDLREYDWGQVSIIEFPRRVIDTTDCNSSGGCKYKFHETQKTFKIPVQTLKTAMTQHGHSRVHMLKLDVEGSEYAFLETMIDDLSCRNVDQLVLEWHHYDHDIRYGVTSNPQINVLVALLKERCGLEQFWIHGSKGWPSNQKNYAEMGMTLYYTLSSFKRTTWKF